MNRTEWEVSHLTARPVTWVNHETGRQLPSQDLFQLHLSSIGGGGGWHSDIVHIPKTLQAYFLQDNVSRFSVEVLPIGRLGSRLLPGDPGALVRAVTTRAGQRITAIPTQLNRAHQFLRLGALIFCATSVLLLSASPALAALSLAAGALSFRAALDIPVT